MAVNWSLLGPPQNPGLSAIQGYEQAREFKKKQDFTKALSSYVQNPGDVASANKLLAIDPMAFMQIDGKLKAQRKEALEIERQRQLGTIYASQGPQAAVNAAASMGDPEAAERFNKLLPKPADQGPASVQEFEFAKGQGFNGNYMDFLETRQGPIATRNEDGTITLTPRSAIRAGGQPPAASPTEPSDINVLHGALLQQESGNTPGRRGPQTEYGRPIGAGQMLEGTAKEMASRLGVPWRPDLYSGTTSEAGDYQRRLSRAYLDEGLAKTGNARDALRYYHGGPDRRLWGPKTNAYADAVLGRAGSGGAAKPEAGQVRAQAQAALAAGADPAAVKARAAALGVQL